MADGDRYAPPVAGVANVTRVRITGTEMPVGQLADVVELKPRPHGGQRSVAGASTCRRSVADGDVGDGGRSFVPRRVLFRWDDRLEGDVPAQEHHLDHLIGALSWLRERLVSRGKPLTKQEVHAATKLVNRAGR